MDEDTEARAAALILSQHLPCAGSPSRCCGGNGDESDPPGVGTRRGHRNLRLAERGAGWAGERRAGASQGASPSGRSPGRCTGTFQAEGTARAEAWGGGAVLCRGWGRGLAEARPGRWQDQGCLGSLSLPPHLVTGCLGPSPPSHPISCSLRHPRGEAAAQWLLPFSGGGC